MTAFRRTCLLSAITLFAATFSLHAEVNLPAIFGDHMVLQEKIMLPVWGTADPGEVVTVTVGKESAKATADAKGQWKAELAPLPTNAAPVTVTVAGKTNTVTFTDVLIGDVWICSGQSNMEFNLGGKKFGFGGEYNADDVLPKVNDPQLRLFLVTRKTAIEPQTDVVGKWELCTPESAGPFSAVGYFFGRELRKTLNKPIGLIGTYWGGTPAQAWTSISKLKSIPALQDYADAYEKNQANFAQATQDVPNRQAEYKAKLEVWNKGEEGVAYEAERKAWKEESDKAVTAGQAPPHAPRPPHSMPMPPPPPDGGPRAPVTLFNGMIAPLIPYGIKGAIWYQGESNGAKGAEYKTLFPAMITDWRERWGEGNFPFLYVQLANFISTPNIESWPYLREAQLKTLSLENTGMASAIDIGVPNNIHPQDKEDVGYRLSLAARHIAYGEKLVYSGPIYQAMKVDGAAISLTFSHEGSGLIIGKAPWVPTGFQPLPNDKLIGFTIAGADKNFVPADAKIVGNTVVVSSAQVAKPLAVRYDWANNAQGNLYNKENLPASSFRTDDWSDPVAEGLVPAKEKDPAAH